MCRIFAESRRSESNSADLSRVRESIERNNFQARDDTQKSFTCRQRKVRLIGLSDSGVQSPSSERSTISRKSRERFGALAIRRNAASARARRTDSSERQERNAVVIRAATCGFLVSSSSTVSATNSYP